MIILPEFLIAVPGKAPLQGYGVRIVDDRIDLVAPHADLRHLYPDDDVEEAPNHVLSPGFVNAHAHLYGLLAHGLPLTRAPSGFWPFLEEFWWPLVEDKLDHEMICAATDAMLLEMIRSGTTTVYDCTEAPHALPGCLEAQAQVVRKRGMRAILSFEATERVSPENGELGLQENMRFVEACRQAGGLVSGLLCFHTTFSCSAEFIQRAHALGAALDVPVHMHCSEGVHEPEYALRTFGMRPMEYYDSLGVANPRMLASQCVQMSDAEIALMAARGARMTHMPLSNCEVGAGIAPVPQLVAAGVPVGLGSDGYVNDFYEVVRATFLIHKAAHQDPRVMPAPLVWKLATEGGAQVLGLEHVGRIEAGWQADLQLVRLDLPTPVQLHNLYDQLVLWRSAKDVAFTMVAGRVLQRDGVVIGADEGAIRRRAQAAATRLWQMAG
jgi:cytosine/adenosine deaminase-related metal-dependent hydrolase